MKLESLIAPIKLKSFFARYWQKQPLIVARNKPDFYKGLITSSDFEFLVSSLTNPQDGWFSLVKERARPPAESMLSEEKLVNLSEIYGAFTEGYSLLLNQVQKRHRATGVLCRQLEISLSEFGVTLSRHIGANAYLSPANSQGFSIHYDPHDVFILQLEGHKHWRLYGRHVQFPIEPPPVPIPRDEAGPPQKDFYVGPGDLIYIPRGFLHDAETDEESSLHVTLSVECATWRDLIAVILSSDSRFRETLPRYFNSRSRISRLHLEEFASVVSHMTKSPALPSALSQVTLKLFSNLESLPNGGFGSIDRVAALNEDTLVSLGEGVFGWVEDVDDAVILHFPGASLKAGKNMASTFRFLLKRGEFRPRELPVKSSAEEKVKFVQQLMISGYLVPKP
jgi:ribosomal protein L16 Arg81 hydroxylase